VHSSVPAGPLSSGKVPCAITWDDAWAWVYRNIYVGFVDRVVGLMAPLQHGIAVDEEQGWGDWGSLEQPSPVWLGLF